MFCLNSVFAFLDVGGPEMLLIFVLILVLFGGKRMPELARGLGKSLRDFKRARDGVEDQIKRALQDDPVPAKKVRKPESATTTPDDTTVYDGAANAAGAGATAAVATDGVNADDSPAVPGADAGQGDSGNDGSDDYIDPYEDEYIGGTAESNAGAHGIEADDAGGKTTESIPEQPEGQEPGATDAGRTEKKKDAPDAGAVDGEGI